MSRALGLLAAITLSAAAATGCALHGAMHGSSGRAVRDGSVQVKEVERDPIVVTLRVPPLFAGQEAVLSMTARDTRSGQAFADAAVSVAIRPLDAPSAAHGHGVAGATEVRADASVEGGEHRVRYAFPAPGAYDLRAMVKTPEHEDAVVVAVTAHVEERAKAHHGGVRPLAMVAAAGMGVMMLLKWIAF